MSQASSSQEFSQLRMLNVTRFLQAIYQLAIHVSKSNLEVGNLKPFLCGLWNPLW